MPKEDTNSPPRDKAADPQATAHTRRRVRHRLIGTLSLAAVVLFLWQLGQDSPPIINPQPPPQHPPTLTAPNLEGVQEQLQNTPDFADDATPWWKTNESVSVSAITLSSPNALTMVDLSTVIAEDPMAMPKDTPIGDAPTEQDPLAEVLAQIADYDKTAQRSPFVVQIGAFASITRAQQQAAALQQHKFNAHIQRSADKTLYRVWAVGYQTRAEAERAQQDIQRLLKVKSLIIKNNHG